MAIIVLQIMLGAAFLLSGLSKLAGVRQHVNNFKRWGLSQQARKMVGGVELAAAVLMLIGIGVHALAVVAGLVLAIAMAVAVNVHRKAKDPISQWAAAVVFLVVSLAVAISYIA